MKLTSTTEILTREVSVPDESHRGVRFSSTRFGSSTVEIDFARWVDMRYPNKIVLTISVPGEHPHDETPTAQATA